MATLARLAVLLLVISLGHRTHAQWNTPYLEAPPDQTVDVDFFSTSDIIFTSAFNEAEPAEVMLAVINYKGSATPTFVASEGDITKLGISFTQDASVGNKWLVKSTLTQDFEVSSKYIIEIRVPGSSSVVTYLTIQVKNINDNTPFFGAISAGCSSVPEDATGETACEFTITDVDGITPSATLTVEPSDLFSLTSTRQDGPNSIKTKLSIIGQLDYETARVHMVTLTANDGIFTSAPLDVILRVNDVADQDPIWIAAPPPILSIPENSPTSLTYTARDGDAGNQASPLTYSLLEGAPSYFTVSTVEGKCILDIETIDRDVDGSEFSITIRATEENDAANFVEQAMQILVTDVNDIIPSISPDELVAEIEENHIGNIEFGDIDVSDADTGAGGQYTVELVDDSEFDWKSAFRVIPSSGYQNTKFTITVTDPSKINYEDPNWRQISLKFRVIETGDNTHTAEVPITITVKNVNDESPTFSETEYRADISETVTSGTTVLTVSAVDNDPDDEVTYQFSTTTTALQIDSTTGAITVARDYPFDFEFQKEVVLQVVATDSAAHRSTVQVVFTITDENDTPPTISVANEDFLVPEHSEPGFEVTRGITAVDPDENAQLQFEINWDQTFATSRGVRVSDATNYIDCVTVETEYNNENNGDATAVIKSADVPFDYEIFDTLYLRLVVRDTQQTVNNQREATLTISVTNVNDNRPVFDAKTTGPKSIRENSIDQLIGYVVATDPDLLDPITYEIEPVEPAPEGWIVINPTTGEIRTSSDNAQQIDAESFPKLEYKVIAKDSNPDEAAEVTITINALDANDQFPVFNAPGGPYEIPENSPGGTPIVTVSATDEDISEPYGKKLEYFLSSEFPEQANYFAVDRTTGEVTVKEGATLDRDGPNGGAFTIELNVVDNSPYTAGYESTQNSGRTSVQVQLTDENDSSPVFEEVSGNIEVNENVDPDYLVYAGISAPDADAPGTDFSAVTYEIVSITPPSDDPPFKLENRDNKADIKTARLLNDEYGLFTLRIKATDGGGNTNEKDFDLQINVLDVNDNAPDFVWPDQDDFQIRVDVNQVVGAPLVDENGINVRAIEGNDVDNPENGNGKFSLSISGDDEAQKYLSIETTISNRARLVVKEPFPTEGLLVFSLTLVATDEGNPPLSKPRTGRVFIITTNEVPPIFEEGSDLEFAWDENTPDVSQVLPTASDLNNENQEQQNWQPIFLHIIDGDDDNVFQITHELVNFENVPTIRLRDPTGTGLDSDEGPDSYTLRVIASNDNFPPNGVDDERSVITVTINVNDLPDSKPKFVKDLNVGGIAPTDIVGVEILRIEATDSDVGDKLTYSIVPDTIVGSEDYLEAVKDNAFDLDPDTGNLKTKFAPEDYMKGYFTFKVQVMDTAANTAETDVQIYIINDSNRVRFLFLNDVGEVDSQRPFIAGVFTDNLGYECAIDYVTQTEEGKESVTSVRTHFIDTSVQLPVDGGIIESRASNLETLTNMRNTLITQNLNLLDVTTTRPPEEDNTAAVLTIVLIVVSVVLGSLVALLLIAFVIKTRSLNRRLEALSTTKFGSQESGLNRISMNVPNTNRHAIEGSNPVWNEEVPNYDNQSQNSGDSELIGIEDQPDFAYDNQNYRSSIGNFYGEVDEKEAPSYHKEEAPDTPTTYL